VTPPSSWISTGIASLALVATSVNVYYTNSSYRLNQETQKATIFSQFQQQYSAIDGRFPAEVLSPDYHPARGSDEYRRLLDYWIFCYSEWYETQKNGAASYKDLWDDYYAGLISHAFDIPSLRFVLMDMFQSYGTDGKDMQEFYNALRQLAADKGKPLVGETQAPAMAKAEAR
jgi:hypothetical protein